MFRRCASLLLLTLATGVLAAADGHADELPAAPASAAPAAPGAPSPADAAPPLPGPPAGGEKAAPPEPPAQLLPSDEASGNLTFGETTQRGIRLFQQGDFDGAIQAFTAAYVLNPRPMLLFNIGQAHRKAGRPQEALTAYQLFLRKAPDSPLRPETEAYIELVRDKLKEPPKEKAPAQEPAKDAARPPLLPAGEGPPRPEPVRPVVPLYKRAWLWGVVGATVAVATGVAVGVYLGTRPPETTLGIIEPTF